MLDEGTARVWLAEPDVSEDDQALVALLSPDEKERFVRYLRADDRKLFLAAHTLLRKTLSRYAPTAPEAWSFVHNQYGRPEVADGSLRFSLSHAPGLVGCMVTRAADCGLDIEDTTRVDEPLELAHTVFSDDECRLLERADADLCRRRFFEIWTLKEAYVKARGMGLSLPLDRFSFGFEGGITFDSSEDPPQRREDWQFALLYPSERHVAAVAIRRHGADMNIVSPSA